MDKLQLAVRGCGVLFRKLFHSPKMFLTLATLGFLFDNMLGTARNLYDLYGVRLNGWGLLPCVLSTPLNLSWIAIGFTFLMSDAPFFDESRFLEKIRSSRSSCIVYREVFVVCSAVLYVVVLTAILSLVSGATLFSPNQWDRAMKSMARGVELDGVDIVLHIPSMILSSFSPIQAWLRASIRLATALSCMGLMQMLFALLVGKKTAILFSSLLIFLDFAVGYMGLGYRLYRVSPLSWARLDILLLGQNQMYFPSMAYGLWAGLVLLAGLCLGMHILARKPKLFDRVLD